MLFRSVVLILSAILAARSGSAVASDVTGPAHARDTLNQTVPPAGPTDIDHYKCWTVAYSRVKAQIAYLQDQFDLAGVPGASAPTHETVAVGRPEWFCNPTRKIHAGFSDGIDNANNHLTCYQIKDVVDDPAVTRAVVVTNQFGADQTLRVTTPRNLCVPTQKVQVDGAAPPFGAGPPSTDLDHYKCYDVKGEAPKESATLQDQFDFAVGPNHVEAVRVVDPVLLCNPTRKHHVLGFDAAGNISAISTGINHVDSHLVCYRIVEPEQLPHKLLIANQFGREQQIATRQSDMLCVPSFKTLASVGGVDPNDGGSATNTE